LTEQSFNWVITGENLTGEFGSLATPRTSFSLLLQYRRLVCRVSQDYDKAHPIRFTGISVPDILLSAKQVTLQGLNGLQGGVKIETFNLPNNDPAGGIQLTLQTTVTNVSYCQASRIIGLNLALAVTNRDATQLNFVRHVF
jgi:hypothetical protein